MVSKDKECDLKCVLAVIIVILPLIIIIGSILNLI